MKYAICEISGKQYLVKPGQTLEVDKLGEDLKNVLIDKVLLVSDGDNVEIGKPYLKDAIEFDVLENIKKPKIRVATYKAKANYRRVKGFRRQVSVIKMADKSVKK